MELEKVKYTLPDCKIIDTNRSVRAPENDYLIDREVCAELERRGHEFNFIGDWSMGVGGGQGIAIDADTGSFMGGADPRRDGYALGW